MDVFFFFFPSSIKERESGLCWRPRHAGPAPPWWPAAHGVLFLLARRYRRRPQRPAALVRRRGPTVCSTPSTAAFARSRRRSPWWTGSAVLALSREPARAPAWCSGLVLMQPQTIKQGHRRLGSAASSTTRLDAADNTFSEDKTFPRMLIMPSPTAIVVGSAFPLGSFLLATVFSSNTATILMCDPDTEASFSYSGSSGISCPIQVLKYASIPMCLASLPTAIWPALWMTFSLSDMLMLPATA